MTAPFRRLLFPVFTLVPVRSSLLVSEAAAMDLSEPNSRPRIAAFGRLLLRTSSVFGFQHLSRTTFGRGGAT